MGAVVCAAALTAIIDPQLSNCVGVARWRRTGQTAFAAQHLSTLPFQLCKEPVGYCAANTLA